MRLKDIIVSNVDSLKNLEANKFYEYLRNHIQEIQNRYAQEIMNIVDKESTETMVKTLWSNIEALALVDENDAFYRNTDGLWASEFRQNYANYHLLPEAKEYPIFKRVVLFILEDSVGNIIVSRRSPSKSHPNILEIPWGHVSVGYGYLETCKKELEEELGFVSQSLSESERLFKFRSTAPDPKPKTHGRWVIMTTYRVNIPSIDSLSPDASEIAELITMNPMELFLKIQSNDEAYRFDSNHACQYLEYLKMRLPNKIQDILIEQKKYSHLLTKIDTFSSEEKYN